MFCKRLTFQNPGEKEPVTILGLVVKQDGELLEFKTARRFYVVNRKLILSLYDTNQPFVEKPGEEAQKC